MQIPGMDGPQPCPGCGEIHEEGEANVLATLTIYGDGHAILEGRIPQKKAAVLLSRAAREYVQMLAAQDLVEETEQVLREHGGDGDAPHQ